MPRAIPGPSWTPRYNSVEGALRATGAPGSPQFLPSRPRQAWRCSVSGPSDRRHTEIATALVLAEISLLGPCTGLSGAQKVGVQMNILDRLGENGYICNHEVQPESTGGQYGGTKR